jgi:cytochrome P450
LHTLYGDSIALIIAGSDTVAYTMVYITYYLAKYPEEVEKLRQEQAREGVTDLHDFRKLQALPHLNGVINEVLRLHPAVPTGGLRETPAEGIEIGGKWVPGNTLICAPRWTISRRELLSFLSSFHPFFRSSFLRLCFVHSFILSSFILHSIILVFIY